MAANGSAAFLQALREFGLVASARVDEIARTLQPRFPEVRGLAQELVRQGDLTTFQARRLLEGRGQTLVVESYRLLDRLGEGGMGEVFKARHLRMDRVVALKLIQKGRVQPDAIERFLREARAAAQLSHPNIVVAHDAGQAGATHFIAMEYVEGVDLARLVQQSGRLAIGLACDFTRQAALGLQHAFEKGIVHRDIKPGNLLATKNGSEGAALIKILDFGLARFESETDGKNHLTQVGKVVGTVDYISPEQAENARKADIRSDIYSLGCSLFYLLTAQPPFAGDTAVERLSARVMGAPQSLRALRPEVPVALEHVLTKLLARNPAHRFQTPAEVASVLGPFAQQARVKAINPRSVSAKSGGNDSSSKTVADGAIQPLQRAEPNTCAILDQMDKTSPDLIPVKPGARAAANKRLTQVLGIAGAAVVGFLLLSCLLIVVLQGGKKDDPKTVPLAPDLNRGVVKSMGPNPPAVVLKPDRNGIALGEAKQPGVPPPKEKQDRPLRANIPFDAQQARKHQEAWAAYLGVPAEATNSIGMKLVLIPPGHYVPAKPGKGELKKLEISEPFYLGKYEVTQREYQSVMEHNPSFFFPKGRGGDRVGTQDTGRFPVESVSWDEAIALCNKLSEKEGRKPYYGAAGKVLGGDGYRLPREAEWEIACRAGTNTTYSFGDAQALLGEYGWYGLTKDGRVHPVGEKKGNGFGLFDMHGNVWEWCEDTVGLNCVLRGGSYNSPVGCCGAAHRHAEAPAVRNDWLGLRLARFPAAEESSR